MSESSSVTPFFSSHGAVIIVDTETTGLSVADDIWEFAGKRYDPDGGVSTMQCFIQHDEEKCKRLPEAFYQDHARRFRKNRALKPSTAAATIHRFLSPGVDESPPHIIGAVPNFDTERLSWMLADHGYSDPWHYHLMDIENLVVGVLMGAGAIKGFPALPLKSDDLSRAIGVEPPGDGVRHTALGDVLWVEEMLFKLVKLTQSPDGAAVALSALKVPS